MKGGEREKDRDEKEKNGKFNYKHDENFQVRIFITSCFARRKKNVNIYEKGKVVIESLKVYNLIVWKKYRNIV